MVSSPYIHNVTKQDYAVRVTERSRVVLVVADFWAAWCQPCQMLMPILARLTDEYQGRFELAKIDTEQERELAAEHGIRSLPTVRLYRHGKVVDEFMGALPENAIRAWLERYLPRPSDAAIDAALAAAKENRTNEAIAMFRQVVADDADNNRGKLALAGLLIDSAVSALIAGGVIEPRVADSETLLKNIRGEQSTNPDLALLKGRLALLKIVATAPSISTLESRVAANERDIEAHYLLGVIRVLVGEPDVGLKHLLAVVQQDRKFGDDAGRRAMIDVFNVLGNGDALVPRFRSLLSSALN